MIFLMSIVVQPCYLGFLFTLWIGVPLPNVAIDSCTLYYINIPRLYFGFTKQMSQYLCVDTAAARDNCMWVPLNF